MPGHERPPQAPSLTEVPRALADGPIEVLGLMPNASNSTFLARCGGDEESLLAIYKPAAGEAPLWDFPTGTLHRREVAAWEVAAALGWPNVPPTVMREGPAGVGSLQLCIRFDPSQHFFTIGSARDDDFRRVALFDVVVNNADRKAGHCLLDADERIWAIDHGVCFHEEPKLRTVIWDYVGEPIPADARDDLDRLRAALEGPVGSRLRPLLSAVEIEALEARLRVLLDAGVFPEPDPTQRPYPWPPI